MVTSKTDCSKCPTAESQVINSIYLVLVTRKWPDLCCPLEEVMARGWLCPEKIPDVTGYVFEDFFLN